MNKKKEINELIDEEKNKELTELLKALIAFLVLTIFFGYGGYSYCLSNGYDTQRGIIFGALFPMGLAVVYNLWSSDSFAKYVIYAISYFIIISNVPNVVGIVILALIVVGFIAYFIYICKKDRSKNIKIAKPDIQYVPPFSPSVTSRKSAYKSDVSDDWEMTEKIDMDDFEEHHNQHELDDFEETEYDYHCARCDKEISEEEYDEYGEICEDCFSEVNSDDRYYGDDFDMWR